MDSDRVRGLLEQAGLGAVAPRTALGGLLAGLVVVSLAAWRFWPSAPAPDVAFQAEAQVTTADGPGDQEQETPPGEVVVHVVGAVMRPGVYRLEPGSRVADAIAAAGGELGSADVDGVNLARILSDGEQVYVPTPEESVAPGGVGQGAGAGGAGSAGLVNLNTADATELEQLPGIGPATAQKIIEDRETNGPFKSPEDLMRVTGIGQKKFDALAELVTCR